MDARRDGRRDGARAGVRATARILSQRNCKFGQVFYTRPDIMVPAMLQVQAGIRLKSRFTHYDVYNIEAEGLGQRLISATLTCRT